MNEEKIEAERAANKEAKIAEMIKILKQHDIEMKVDACGCCDSPWVSFSYKGDPILHNQYLCDFDTTKDKI